MSQSLLVIQLARLGDLVQTWPFLRRLHQGGAGSLELLLDKRVKALTELGPPVAAGWELDFVGLSGLVQKDLPQAYAHLQNLVSELRKRDYIRVYNLNFSRLSLLLAYLIGGEVQGYRPVRGGREFFREPWLAWIYALVHARRFNRVHLSDVFRHLAPPVSWEAGAPPLRLPKGEPVVALQLATRHASRTWHLKAFIRLAEVLVARLGVRVWLLGTKVERPLGDALREALPRRCQEQVENLQGKTDLLELAGRLREVHLLISGDTGTLHLAAALGTRTLGLYLGPASCFETGPYGDGHYVIQAEPPCHPCAEAGPACPEPFCQSMIPPEGVAELVEALLKQGKVLELPRFPAGTRVYRSFWDYLGVNYAPLGSFWNARDVVGEAYRQAGASLLGLARKEVVIPELVKTDREDLQNLLAILGNGAGKTLPSQLKSFLVPLKAFQEELARQSPEGMENPLAAGWSTAIKTGFQEALEEFLKG